MSLHCPARFLLVPPEALDALSAAVRAERVATVVAGDAERPLARRTAATLGVPFVAVEGVSARWEETLVPLADLHRGETVLAVVPPDALTEALVVEVGDEGVVVAGRLRASSEEP